MDIKKFQSIKEMNKTAGVPGQYASVGNKVYIYVDNKERWKPFSPSGEQIEITQNAYEMAKIVAAQAPLLTEEQIENTKILIKEYLNNYQDRKYFMLMVRDINYHTLFVINENNDENISDIIIECLSNIGDIIDINNETEEAIEAWVKDKKGEAHIGYFFPYDQGVVECKLS